MSKKIANTIMIPVCEYEELRQKRSIGQEHIKRLISAAEDYMKVSQYLPSVSKYSPRRELLRQAIKEAKK